MTTDNPITGIGLDGFRDSYHRYRDISAATRDPWARVTSAHNVFLDISSYGGFPLLTIYFTLMALVIVSAIKVVNRSKAFNPVFAGLVGGWAAFQAQSIISINQIGLAIWGWVLSGLIIGYEINTRNVMAVETVAKKGRAIAKHSPDS